MFNISLLTCTLLGINWLACHVRTLVCFDENTEKMRRFEYAKCLFKFIPDKELPDMIRVGDENGHYVHLQYSWRPLICTVCKCFGHALISCDMKAGHSNLKENHGDSKENHNDSKKPIKALRKCM